MLPPEEFRAQSKEETQFIGNAGPAAPNYTLQDQVLTGYNGGGPSRRTQEQADFFMLDSIVPASLPAFKLISHEVSYMIKYIALLDFESDLEKKQLRKYFLWDASDILHHIRHIEAAKIFFIEDITKIKILTGNLSISYKHLLKDSVTDPAAYYYPETNYQHTEIIPPARTSLEESTRLALQKKVQEQLNELLPHSDTTDLVFSEFKRLTQIFLKSNTPDENDYQELQIKYNFLKEQYNKQKNIRVKEISLQELMAEIHEIQKVMPNTGDKELYEDARNFGVDLLHQCLDLQVSNSKVSEKKLKNIQENIEIFRTLSEVTSPRN